MLDRVSGNVFAMPAPAIEKEKDPKVEQGCISWLVEKITAIFHAVVDFIAYIFCCGSSQTDKTEKVDESNKHVPKEKRDIKIPADLREPEALPTKASKAACFQKSGFVLADVSDHRYWEQKISYFKIETLYTEAANLGAEIVPYIQITKEGNLRIGDLDTARASYEVELVEGVVYPMCTGGINRSQCMRNHLIASGIPPERVAAPHGLSEAVDPTFSKAIAPLEQWYSLKKLNATKDGLVDVERVLRYGEEAQLVVKDSAYFEKTLWLKIIDEGGTVVVIGTALSAAMKRLVDVAQNKGKDLSKVKIVGVHSTDPFKEDVFDNALGIIKFLKGLEMMRFKQAFL